MNATTTPGPLFQMDNSGHMACIVCHGVETVETQEIPSMEGSGSEVYERCTRCGSTDSLADPFKGTRRVHAAWKPSKTAGTTWTYGE